MDKKISFGEKLGLTRSQARALAQLRTPERIQDYVSKLPTNFEPEGDTCLSVVEVLKQRRAHCIEGAFLAACALWLNGQKPMLMDLRALEDDDHVVALFKRGRHWGAISKSNHIWLRWRDPIYRNLRELAISYFHEDVRGASKTLWSYSVPFDLRRVDPKLWVSNGSQCWEIAEALDDIPHFPLLSKAQAKRLRRRDRLEIQAGKFLEHEAPDAKTALRY